MMVASIGTTETVRRHSGTVASGYISIGKPPHHPCLDMRSLACARTPLKYVPCAYVKCSLPNRYAHALRSHKFFSSTDETNPVRQQPASSIAKPACMNMIRADARMIHLAQGSLFTNNVFDCCMESLVFSLHVSKFRIEDKPNFKRTPLRPCADECVIAASIPSNRRSSAASSHTVSCKRRTAGDTGLASSKREGLQEPSCKLDNRLSLNISMLPLQINLSEKKTT